jgi:hypothetical protein
MEFLARDLREQTGVNEGYFGSKPEDRRKIWRPRLR